MEDQLWKRGGRLSLGVLPEGLLRLSVRFGEAAVYIDFERPIAERLGQALIRWGDHSPAGGLPATKDGAICGIVDGAVEGFREALEEVGEPVQLRGADFRLLVMGVGSNFIVSANNAAVRPRSIDVLEAD